MNNAVSLVQPMPVLNYPTKNYIKHRDIEIRSSPSPHIAKTPDRSCNSSAIPTPAPCRENTSNDQEEMWKTQVLYSYLLFLYVLIS